MTNRERLLTCLRGDLPDCVPVAPDFSNMIPARLTGKPFWDLYLWQDPPIWEAYIDCAKYFDIDSLMDNYFPFQWPGDPVDPRPWETFIVHRREDMLVTQRSYVDDGRRVWEDTVTLYYPGDPPTGGKTPAEMKLPPEPTHYEPVEDVKPVDRSVTGLGHIKQRMGDQGLVGISLIGTGLIRSEKEVFLFYDEPEIFHRRMDERMEQVYRRFADLEAMAPEDRPDFICVGGSGTLVFQTPQIFHEWTFPAIRKAIELVSGLGIPTHVHSCGPETALVKIFAEESNLTVIDPLEIPPMGDCHLAELKRLYGDRRVLKGNLHTTEVMLKGSVEDVVAASKQAIDDAAAGGRFILSTGDQCGRDTPDEDLHAMIETARTYGRY